MQSLHALSLAPGARDWLANSRYPRILHVFDGACNLINERRELLSIVTAQIGNGPFNLVVEDDVCFSSHLDLRSPISISTNVLTLGNLTITASNTKLWSPRPDWEALHMHQDGILNRLTSLPSTGNQFSHSLASSIANADLPAALTAAAQLAGSGIGLTPAGDDFIMGALLAAWIIHPPEIAQVLAEEIANTAAPLTTSLSAAWLRSAGRGQAGTLWHDFFDALISGDRLAVRESMGRLLAIGHTSGADALAGFLRALRAAKEIGMEPCPS